MLIAFLIIVIHFVADFILQDEKWAVGKSKSFVLLLKRTATYSLVWFLIAAFLINFGILPSGFWWFAPITFVAHTATDYFTSKWTSKLYREGKFGSPIPNLGFFSVIGFDQVLHYAQLFLTFYLFLQ